MYSQSKLAPTRFRSGGVFKRLAIAALLLQVLVPSGYMPAAVSSGWLLQLCPDGMSPGAMQILHGGHTQHLASPDHLDHSQSHQSSVTLKENEPDAARYECPLAALGGDLANLDGVSAFATIQQDSQTVLSNISLSLVRLATMGYLSRAPPQINFA